MIKVIAAFQNISKQKGVKGSGGVVPFSRNRNRNEK